MSTLMIGFGNIDRGDDGASWHILSSIKKTLTKDDSIPFHEEIIQITPSLDMLFALQLTPEMSQEIKDYQRVCFIDTHTGSFDDDFHHAAVFPSNQISPFTHHLTPPAFLSLVKQFYGNSPDAIHFSIRGHEFNFTDVLSPQTQSVVNQAVPFIMRWLQEVKTSSKN